MPNRSVIVVSAPPRGHFIEGKIKDGVVVYPGQHVQIDAAEDLVDGRPVYKLWDGAADGEMSELILVRENELLGGTVDDAYPAGARALLYAPAKGDEVQVRFANVGTGTGAGEEDITVGDKLILDKGTGNVVVTTGSPEQESYTAMETVENITEDTLVLVRVL